MEEESISSIHHSKLINIFSAITSKIVIAWQIPQDYQENNFQEHYRGNFENRKCKLSSRQISRSVEEHKKRGENTLCKAEKKFL